MRSILKKLFGTKRKDTLITIVSGLPRSGTSLMMQMLEAGGMPVVIDNIRKPDDDNPRGYYEFEKVKKVKEDVSWLEDCYGKAFKMVSMLLYDLPPEKHYRIIFMKRDMKEVLASQRLMLERMGKPGRKPEEGMLEKYEKHLSHLEGWLAKQGNIEVVFKSYNDIIEQPLEHARQVNEFLGGGLDTEKMASVVEGSLYRQKKKDISTHS
jgi:hypothetical protein